MLDKKVKDAFHENVDRSSTNAKITDLMKNREFILKNMRYAYEL